MPGGGAPRRRRLRHIRRPEPDRAELELGDLPCGSTSSRAGLSHEGGAAYHESVGGVDRVTVRASARSGGVEGAALAGEARVLPFRPSRRRVRQCSLPPVLLLGLGIAACSSPSDPPPTNHPPTASITLPATGGAIREFRQSFLLAGSGSDDEDGKLSSTSLAWASDLDGSLGAGDTIKVGSLTRGEHTVTLTATDSEGATGRAAVIIDVVGSEITSPVMQASGAPHTVLLGEGVTFSGSAFDAEDGELTGDAIVWVSNVDGRIGTGRTFTTAALRPGLHTVTFTASNSVGQQRVDTVLVVIREPVLPGFQIHARLAPGSNATLVETEALAAAVARVEAVIIGDLSDVPSLVRVATPCGGGSVPAVEEPVDDLVVYVQIGTMDGPQGILAAAAPCVVRSGSALAVLGHVQLDQADSDQLHSAGQLVSVLVHELLHVLGFGSLWENPPFDPELLQDPSDGWNPRTSAGSRDAHFVGSRASAAFIAMGGDAYTGGQVVPVENDGFWYGSGSLDSHWRESVLGNELMTPEMNPGSNPLSAVTVAQFEDLGYAVDYGAAEAYEQTFALRAPGAGAGTIRLGNDAPTGRLDAVDSSGRLRRIR